MLGLCFACLDFVVHAWTVVHASELAFANWSPQSFIAFGHPSQRFKVRKKIIELI